MASNEAVDISWAAAQYSRHGSTRIRLRRFGTVVNVHRSGGVSRSSQSIGIDTLAPGLARGENAAIEVLVRLFRK